MACQISYDEAGKVVAVRAPNMQPSVLFQDIQQHYSDLNGNQATEVWVESYTPEFITQYEGGRDQNGEAIFEDAQGFLVGVVDEIRFSADQTEKIRGVAAEFEMKENGFLPARFTREQIERALKTNNIRDVKVRTLSNGVHYLEVNKNFYNPFEQNYYKDFSDPELRDWKLSNAVIGLLSQLGVQVEWSDELGANIKGQADTLNRIILLAEGKADMTTLTREAMHIVVSMMRGSARYSAMIEQIMKMPEYERTKMSYGGLYSEGRIAEEALVNYLSDVTEDESQPKRWWELILDYIRGLFSKNPKAVQLFRDTARDILKQDLDSLGIKRDESLAFEFEDEIWFEIEHNPGAQQEIEDVLNYWNKNKGSEMDGTRYIYKDKTLRYRVSDKSAKLSRQIYGRQEFTPELRELYTTKGVIMHMYEELIMQEIIDAPKGPVNINFGPIIDTVYNHLHTKAEFADIQEKSYYVLSNSQLTELTNGLAHLYNSIVEEDPHARFYLEQFVPDEQGDIGGTIDVLVVHGDGTISLFDYKNTQFKRKTRSTYLAPDQDDRKLQLWDHQIARYKEMLKKGLKKGHRDFRYTRIIPVNVQFAGEKLVTIQMGYPGVSRRHLRHIAASHETVWGDEDLNVFMEKLYNERTSLRNALTEASGKERKFIEYRLAQINSDISDIIIWGDLDNMLNGLTQFVQGIKRSVKDLSATGLNSVASRLAMYEHFPRAFKQTIDSVEDEDTQDVLRAQLAYFGNIVDQAIGLVQDERLFRAQQYYDPTGKKKITDGGRGPGLLSETFEGINKMAEPVADTLFKLLREKAEDQRLRLLKYEAEINKKTSAYKKWARKNGHDKGGVSIYAPLIRRTDTKMSLITAYNKAFYDEWDDVKEQYLNNIRTGHSTKKQVEWMETHMVFDEEKWNTFRNQEEKRLKAMGTWSDEKIEEQLSKLNYYNPKIEERAWFMQNNYNTKIREWSDPAMKKFVNPEFTYIMSHQPAKEYYEMLVKYNRMMGDMVGYDYVRSNSIANIRASMVEKLSNWGEFGWRVTSSGMVDLRGAMELREQDELQGVNSDGMPIQQIPLLYTDEILESVGPRETARIRAQVVKDGMDPNNPDFEDEVDKRVMALRRKRGLAQKSQDLTASLKIMLDSAMRYHYMSEIEDEVLMIRSVLDMDKYQQIPTDNFGRRMLNVFTRDAQRRQGSGPDMIKVIDTFLNAHLYGRRTQSDDKTIELGGKRYSRNRLVDRTHQLLSLSTIALNPIIGAANWVNAAVNRNIQGQRGKFYTTQSTKDAMRSLASVEEKALIAMWYMEPKQGNMQRERATRTRAGVLNRVLTSRFAYMFHRGEGPNQFGAKKVKQQLRDNGYLQVENPYWGDDSVGNLILISMMKTWVLDSDGRVKNPHDPFHKIEDENAKTVWDLFQHEGLIENFDPDTIPIEGMSKEEMARFRAMVSRAQSEVKGSTSAWDYSKADSEVMFQLITKFRSWIPAMASARFESLREDTLFDTYTEGYLKGTWSEVVGKGTNDLIRDEVIAETSLLKYYGKHFVLPTIKNFLKLFGEAISFGLYDYQINTKRATYAYNKMILENPELDTDRFTFQAFLSFRQNQIKAAAREVRYLLMSWALIQLIRSATDWDEEDNTNILTRYMYRLAMRANLELSFWFDPQSVTDIIKSPIPAWRLVNDMGKALNNFWVEGLEETGVLDKNYRDKTPMGYYTLKRFPGINQLLSLTGYFPGYNEENTAISRFIEERALKK